jgi:hypothetical protein
VSRQKDLKIKAGGLISIIILRPLIHPSIKTFKRGAPPLKGGL